MNFKVRKSEDWLKAEMAAKKATKKWKSMGMPRNEDNQFFIAKKETRLNLRKSINQNNIAVHIEENNTMMEANFRDQKLFSKLVNQKRNTNQGYTSMIKIEGIEHRGDAQVLSGFFNYHNGNSSPPPLSKSAENTTYFYSTINVEAISYLMKQRKWKLPQLNFNQMQNIIERLKPNKSSDYFGFSAKHVKNGGFVSTHFLMQYMNTSFQYIEQGVPEGELVGCASLVHKGAKKPLSDPKSFRKITVCALLGQMKQMAVCDLALPILKPLKPSSQLGFTPGLFVKLANIMVSEKRALAISNNQIVLYQFLIEDDVWKYFHLLHKNSSTYVKWNGLISKDVINEGKGNRQGGLASADEWKLYNNEMVRQLEQYASEPDTISGIATSCVAVADDVAPCATANHPRDAIHQMQILLNVVEDHGTLHMKFGTDKCKLMISGRQTKTKALSTILEKEPEVLTF